MVIRRGLMAAGLALAGLAWGCGHPASSERIARREQNLGGTAEAIAAREARAGHNLDRTLDTLNRLEQHHAERTRQMPERIGKAIGDEFDRWNRRQPAYQQRIGQELEGDLDNIDRTWPYMLY